MPRERTAGEVALDLVATDDVEDDIDAVEAAPGQRLAQRDSQSAGDRSRTTSAPRSAQRCALPAEQVTATLAPIALAIWIAAVPTPDAPAWTSAHRPLGEPALHHEGVPRGDEHLRDRRSVAPFSPAGTAIAWRAWVTTNSA